MSGAPYGSGLTEEEVLYGKLGAGEPRGVKAMPDRDARACAWCEHFDGGGEAAVLRARQGIEVLRGDCHSRLSPRFTTDSIDTCPAFVPDSTAKDERP